jgi:hypothetical protein
MQRILGVTAERDAQQVERAFEHGGELVAQFVRLVAFVGNVVE